MHTGRKIAVTVAATALAGTVGAVAAQADMPGSTSTDAAPPTPTCAASGLSASLHDPLAGGMNHAGGTLQLKNTTSHTCVLRGYPGLGLEDAHHKRLDTTTTWGSTWYAQDPGKKTLLLKPGQTVEANMAWTHANQGTGDAVHAAYLVVTPPASTQHKTLRFDEWVDLGDLAVTAMARSVPVEG